MMTARENILAKIKLALETPTEKPINKPGFSADIYRKNPEEDLAVTFARRFRENKAEFFFAQDIEEFLLLLKAYLKQKEIHRLLVREQYLKELLQIANIDFFTDNAGLDQSQASLSLCEVLAARTGSLLLSTHQSVGRQALIYPPQHIVLAFTSQIVYHLSEALVLFKQMYQGILPSMLTLVSGPSKSNLIENQFSIGAQGPQALTLFLVDDQTTSTEQQHETTENE